MQDDGKIGGKKVDVKFFQEGGIGELEGDMLSCGLCSVFVCEEEEIYFGFAKEIGWEKKRGECFTGWGFFPSYFKKTRQEEIESTEGACLQIGGVFF